jgi:hypothetical protein
MPPEKIDSLADDVKSMVLELLGRTAGSRCASTAPTRGKCVPTDFLAGARPKVWLSDRLPAQCTHAEAHQFCLARLIHDAQYAIDHGDTIFAPQFKAFFRMPARSGAGGPISPTAPSQRIGAALTASWIVCWTSSRPMSRAAPACHRRGDDERQAAGVPDAPRRRGDQQQERAGAAGPR